MAKKRKIFVEERCSRYNKLLKRKHNKKDMVPSIAGSKNDLQRMAENKFYQITETIIDGIGDRWMIV